MELKHPGLEDDFPSEFLGEQKVPQQPPSHRARRIVGDSNLGEWRCAICVIFVLSRFLQIFPVTAIKNRRSSDPGLICMAKLMVNIRSKRLLKGWIYVNTQPATIEDELAGLKQAEYPLIN